MSRDSIIFYKSFYDSAKMLGDKARLKLYDAFLDVSFSEYETVMELEQNWNEIGLKLERFRNAFAQFSLIKPHILNSGKQYLNGKKGGAPLKNQNAKKQPKNKQIEIEKEIEYKFLSIGNNLGEDEREILDKYIRKQPNIKNKEAYLNTLINNGTYKNILEQERQKQANYNKYKENENIQKQNAFRNVKDKTSALQYCCQYWNHSGGEQEKSIEELQEKYNLPLTYSNMEYDLRQSQIANTV